MVGKYVSVTVQELGLVVIIILSYQKLFCVGKNTGKYGFFPTLFWKFLPV
jgi:hypothetical protein